MSSGLEREAESAPSSEPWGRHEILQVLKEIFGSDPRTREDRVVAGLYGDEEINLSCCAYGPLVLDTKALQARWEEWGVDLSERDTDMRLINWAGATYNPLSLERQGEWLASLKNSYDQAVLSGENEFLQGELNAFREVVVRGFLGIPLEVELSEEEQQKIDDLKKRLVLLPSGTDGPAISRLAYSEAERDSQKTEAAIVDELGSGSKRATAEGVVPSTEDQPISDKIKKITVVEFKHRLEGMGVNTNLASEIQQFLEELGQDSRVLTIFPFPPKTGVVLEEMFALVCAIADKTFPAEAKLLPPQIDLAQFRPLSESSWEEWFRQAVIAGKVSALLSLSKFLGTPPFVGFYFLSQEEYTQLSQGGFSGDQRLANYAKKGYFHPDLAEAMGVEPGSYNTGLMALIKLGIRNFTKFQSLYTSDEGRGRIIQSQDIIARRIQAAFSIGEGWHGTFQVGVDKEGVEAGSVVTLKLTHEGKVVQAEVGKRIRVMMAKPMKSVGERRRQRALARSFQMANFVSRKNAAEEKEIVFRIPVSCEQILGCLDPHGGREFLDYLLEAVNDMGVKFTVVLDKLSEELESK